MISICYAALILIFGFLVEILKSWYIGICLIIGKVFDIDNLLIIWQMPWRSPIFWVKRIGTGKPHPLLWQNPNKITMWFWFKQEHKVSYRCSLPSPLQMRSKDYNGLHRSSANFELLTQKFWVVFDFCMLRNFLPKFRKTQRLKTCRTTQCFVILEGPNILLPLIWGSHQLCRWSMQRANGKYKDHLVGQLTR